MKHSRNQRIFASQRGMTLIEIMIVLAILGGLLAFLGQNIMSRFGKARVQNTKIQMSEVSKALDLYNVDCGTYPTEEQGLDALINPPTSEPKCNAWGPDPYLKKYPQDAWGGDLIYEKKGSSYELFSFGADGEEGGEGNDADISSSDI